MKTNNIVQHIQINFTFLHHTFKVIQHNNEVEKVYLHTNNYTNINQYV